MDTLRGVILLAEYLEALGWAGVELNVEVARDVLVEAVDDKIAQETDDRG